MEFGKLADISSVNWTLPPDDPNNKSRLHPGTKSSIYLGSPAWGVKHWIGKIYPKKTPPDEFLHYYSRHYSCIELNTSHYRIPDTKATSDWLSKVPPTFKFCPKVFKEISHTKMGLLDKRLLGYWVAFLERIQSNLGPCFIQFHEMFSYHDKKLLFQFLENWPSSFELALELRHPSWFEQGAVLPALVDYLNKKNIGLVITDVAGRRDVLHSSLSADYSLIRLIGNDLDTSDERRLNDWALRIKHWQELGLKETFLFLHQPDDLMTIEFSRLARDVLVSHGYQDVPSFKLKENDDSLLSLI